MAKTTCKSSFGIGFSSLIIFVINFLHNFIMKVLITALLLGFASFSAFAQLDIDVENISGNTITVDFTGGSGGVDARLEFIKS